MNFSIETNRSSFRVLTFIHLSGRVAAYHLHSKEPCLGVILTADLDHRVGFGLGGLFGPFLLQHGGGHEAEASEELVGSSAGGHTRGVCHQRTKANVNDRNHQVHLTVIVHYIHFECTKGDPGINHPPDTRLKPQIANQSDHITDVCVAMRADSGSVIRWQRRARLDVYSSTHLHTYLSLFH